MRSNEYFIVFPEGDIQEVPLRLSIGELVDINGRPLELPLPSIRTIAFRVARIQTKEERNATELYHHLELMSAEELRAYARR
ncbi:hypothetical protein MASR2M78_26410 [Treponema sp.]